jgi:hypothetical protein
VCHHRAPPRNPTNSHIDLRWLAGYSVSSAHEVDVVYDRAGSPPMRVEGFSISVTSKTLGAPDVLRRIGGFLNDFRTRDLAALDGPTVARHASAQQTRLLEPPKRLSAEAATWWAEVRSGSLDWGSRQRLAAALGRVSPADVVALYDATVTRQLSSLVYGTAHPIPAADGPEEPARPSGQIVDPMTHALPRWVRTGKALPLCGARWATAAIAVVTVVAAVALARRR